MYVLEKGYVFDPSLIISFYLYNATMFGKALLNIKMLN
jgi:hypothetical protein